LGKLLDINKYEIIKCDITSSRTHTARRIFGIYVDIDCSSNSYCFSCQNKKENNQLTNKLVEKENDKTFKIKDDGTIYQDG
jgi:hypothetical protein